MLQRITDGGLEDIGDLGPLDSVTQLGATYDIVLVRGQDSVSGVRADGTTAWKAPLPAGQVYAVDGAVVALREGDLILYA